MKNIFAFEGVDPERAEALRALPEVNLTVVDTDEELEEWAVPDDHVADTQILLTAFPPNNLAAMTSLELFQLSSVGYEQLFGLGLVERGVRACNARGIFDVPIAEWNVAMMVNLARDLRGMIRNQEARVFRRPASFQREINGSVVGIWGYGGIGRETARLCRAMGLTVHVLSRSGVRPRVNVYRVPGTGDPEGTLPDRVFTLDQKIAFLRGLDFLVVSMPLTDSTRGIIGQAELEALPSRAYVLNPARGPIIEEEALLHALREGLIAGAALDTHYYYPMPADHPLWGFPNVIMTPHISGSSLSPHFKERLWDILVENVRRYLAGEPLLNELTAQQLSGG